MANVRNNLSVPHNWLTLTHILYIRTRLFYFLFFKYVYTKLALTLLVAYLAQKAEAVRKRRVFIKYRFDFFELRCLEIRVIFRKEESPCQFKDGKN